MNNVEIARYIIEHHIEASVIIANDWLDADKLLSKAKMPAIMMFVPLQGSTTIRNGKRYHTDMVIIACADLVVKDADGHDSIHAYNKARRMADDVVRHLNKSDVFAPIERYDYTTFLNRYSSIISGVFITVQLTDKGNCYGDDIQHLI